jgi:type I restriction enzyme S subunit
VNNGDIVLLWDGSNAGELFLGKEGILSSTMAKLTTKSDTIDKRFLYHFLKAKQDYLQSLTRGTGIPHVDRTIFENLVLFVPPTTEQKEIATVLSTVDDAIQKTDEIIVKTERLKEGIMQKLLAKGMGHKESKKTKIGEMPEDWEVVELGHISIKLQTGPFGSQLKKTELSPTGIKVYSQENVLRNDFLVGDLYIPEEKLNTLRSMIVKPNDVLLTIRGSIGRAAVVPHGAREGIIHSNLAYARLDESKIRPEFLALLINDDVATDKRIQGLTSSTTLGALYGRRLRMLKLPLPSIQEQQEITAVLVTVDESLHLQARIKSNLERVKQVLANLLLTGNVRIKVN